MTGKDLLEAMNDVDEIYIEEGEYQIVRKTVPWKKLGALAACLCVLVAAAFSSGIFPEVRDTTESAVESAPQNFDSMDAEAAPESDEALAPGCVVLRVETISADGFTATVTDPGGNDIFSRGAQVQVILDSWECAPGDLLRVWFQTYDLENQIIYAELVIPADE